MYNHNEDEDRPEFLIVFFIMAMSGALVGGLIGVFAGWLIWG